MIGTHLFDLKVVSPPPIYCPDGGHGAAFVGGVTSGTFEGERLAGTVLPAGGDWARVTPCGTAKLDVQLILRTHVGDLVTMRYAGRMHGPGDTLARLGGGESIPPDQYYMRVAPVFEAHADSLTWLNRVLAIGTGEVRQPGLLHYRIFEIA